MNGQGIVEGEWDWMDDPNLRPVMDAEGPWVSLLNFGIKAVTRGSIGNAPPRPAPRPRPSRRGGIGQGPSFRITPDVAASAPAAPARPASRSRRVGRRFGKVLGGLIR